MLCHEGKDAPSRIIVLRSAVVAGLVIAAALVGTFSYLLLTESETALYETRYYSLADGAMTRLTNGLRRRKFGAKTLAQAISYYNPDINAWPNVTMPGFYDTVTALGSTCELSNLGFLPFVTVDQLAGFESFMYDYFENDPTVPVGAGMHGFKGVFGLDNANSSNPIYHDVDGVPRQYSSPYNFLVPILQVQVDENMPASSIGYNLHSSGRYGPTIDAIVECSARHNFSVAVKSCGRISQASSHPNPTADDPHPTIHNFMTTMLLPIYLNQNSSQLVGIAGGSVDWQVFLEKINPSNGQGLQYVISDGESVFTYQSKGDGVYFLGVGDLHEQEYDKYRRVGTFFAMETEGDSSYHISIYPSSAFIEESTTDTPIYVSVGSVVLILICSAMFCTYDVLMRRDATAQKLVLDTKRRFVRFISHEIRTPLNSVHMGLEAISAEICKAVQDLLSLATIIAAIDTSASSALTAHVTTLNEWLTMAADMMGNSESAVDVLDDLLNYDKIEMGTLRLEFSAVDMWQVVRKCTSSFMLQAKQKGVNVSLLMQERMEGDGDASPTAFCVIGDQGRLAQVLRNLISNALKFTSPQGSIKVYASHVSDALSHAEVRVPMESAELLHRPRGGAIRIAVTDSGAGLSPQQLTEICSEGVQFNANELQAGQGSGLGLFISKGLVQQHGGTLTVSSSGLGTGSTFTIMLPLYQVPNPEDATLLPPSKLMLPDPPAVATASRSRDGAPLDRIGYSPVPAMPLEAPAPHGHPAKCILVVDDAASNRKMLIRLLTARGYVCEQAEDGQAGVDMYLAMRDRGQHLEAVVMDFEMPVMNGPSAARKLRELGCTVPIIGVTGNLLPEDVAYFRNQGANEVLGKPLNISVFEETLRTERASHIV